jgi:hypothetical protein
MPIERVVPDTFDPSIAAPTTVANGEWHSLTRALIHTKATGALSRLPLFWQTESPLMSACKKAQVCVYTNDIGNRPLGAAAIREAGLDAVIIESNDALAFLPYVKESASKLAWIVIHAGALFKIDELLAIPNIRIAQEIHSAPSVPWLVQCETLIDTRANLFHAIKNKESLVTAGTCTCGETLFEPPYA